jgi:hypothetical protein
VRTNIHTSHYIATKEAFEREKHSYNKDVKQFFKLFKESTFEGSQAAARKMGKIADGQMKSNQKLMLFNSVDLLIRFGSEMLSWPNSPLLVILQRVNSNVLIGNEDQPSFYQLAELADPSDYSTHENQVILAKQLIEHGANVNAVSIPQGSTPLHNVCYGSNVTNLDFAELLLKEGADPNTQDSLGVTPLMVTTPAAPGAAKFLLNWPTTDANITAQSGATFLALVRLSIADFSDQIALPDNPDHVQHQFVLQQWRDIEAMLVERDAYASGITGIS